MRGIDFCRLACYNFSMLVGLTTRSLNGECETEQALKLSDDTIAEVCEITLRTFYEYRPEFAKKYADRLGKVREAYTAAGLKEIQTRRKGEWFAAVFGR